MEKKDSIFPTLSFRFTYLCKSVTFTVGKSQCAGKNLSPEVRQTMLPALHLKALRP
jgi:hypothetical protein